MIDFTPRGPKPGTRTISQRYFYVPDAEGEIYREQAVIACTIPGKLGDGEAGPFVMTREVTYGEWVLDPADERRGL